MRRYSTGRFQPFSSKDLDKADRDDELEYDFDNPAPTGLVFFALAIMTTVLKHFSISEDY